LDGLKTPIECVYACRAGSQIFTMSITTVTQTDSIADE